MSLLRADVFVAALLPFFEEKLEAGSSGHNSLKECKTPELLVILMHTHQLKARMFYKYLFLPMLIFFLWSSTGVAQSIQQMPAFQQFARYDNGNQFTVDSLSTEGVNVLIFYDPGCGHCQELGYDIAKNWEIWSPNISFYFISMGEKEGVDRYTAQYAKGLDQKLNVTFLHDPTGEFITLFDPQNFPSTYIYSAKDRSLIQFYDGVNTTKDMQQHLSK